EADLDENNDENSATSQIDSSNRRVTIDNLSRIDLLAIFQALTDHTQLPRHLARFTDNFIVRTTPYHPRTNGRCEKFNGIIKKIWLDIRRVAVEITPEEALKKALLIYNSRPSEHGYSPHFLLFGVAPKLSNPAPAAVFYTREETDEETRS
ncbi:hypothetical protein HI914_06011, partial [Erysiphe necator]